MFKAGLQNMWRSRCEHAFVSSTVFQSSKGSNISFLTVEVLLSFSLSQFPVTQVSRLREDIHNMGTLYMSEICTELKNLRSLVRVCEIQATLREQRSVMPI